MTQLSINTTQNVNISFTAASIGERLLAFLTDAVIQLAYLITVFWGIFYLFGLGDVMASWDDWSRIAVVVLFMLPVMFYTLTFESIFEGQTFGKRLLKIKVVKIDGYQASFGDYLIRWLFRIVEVWGTWILALIMIVVSKKSQRLGDMSAGTAVITLKNNISINSTILEEIQEDYVPTYPSVIKLSDNDIRIIKESFELAKKNQEYAIIEKLKTKILAVTGIKNQMGDDQYFIRTILKDYNFYTQKM